MGAILRRERLIAALDVPTAAEARLLVEKLGSSVSFYKIGLELSTSGEYYPLLDWLVKRGDGVICSGLEVAGLKAKFGAKLLAVTPGIRPAGGDVADQKRVVDVAQAFKSGADYIVVGRPIRDAKDPAAAANAIQATIAEVFP